MQLAAHGVLFAFGGFLVTVGIVTLIRPSLVEEFIRGFAQSARVHYIEQVARLIIGACFLSSSSEMWLPAVFEIVGWLVVGSALLLIVLPWQWHRRFAEFVIPLVIQHMALYGTALFIFGAFVVYGLLRGTGVVV